MPALVCTAIKACTESSGFISALHPPFGLLPNKGAALIEVIRIGILDEFIIIFFKLVLLKFF